MGRLINPNSGDLSVSGRVNILVANTVLSFRNARGWRLLTIRSLESKIQGGHLLLLGRAIFLFNPAPFCVKMFPTTTTNLLQLWRNSSHIITSYID
jgi:hypothetical protein